MKNIMTSDQRSKTFVFVPFCLTCQAFQAEGIVRFGFSSVIRPVLDELLRHDVNIIQMPCPESRLGGYKKGLKRKPQSIKLYNTPEFLAVCEHSAEEVVQMMEGITDSGYKVALVIGVEFSPSCSVKLQYSNIGTFHQPGHFIAALQKKMQERGIEVPFVGINRRGISASVKKINEILSKKLFN